MSLNEFLSDAKQRFGSDLYTTRRAAYVTAGDVVEGVVRTFSGLFEVGPPIWEKEWEVIVILDACRFDAMEEALGTHPKFDGYDITVTKSAATMSYEWMDAHFTRKYRREMNETAIIVANPFTREFDLSPFGYSEEVWRTDWDSELGVVPPAPVVDAAITTWRRRNDIDINRMIVWMMQPHEPFIVDGQRSDLTPPYDKQKMGHIESAANAHQGETVWEKLKRGDVTRDNVWDEYIETLLFGLEDVHRLRRNLDSDSLVVTSDHGEAMGEYGVYCHPARTPIPVLANVPWVKLPAWDSGESVNRTTTAREGTSVEDKLRDLGYLD